MVIDGRFNVAAPPERLLAHLFNARLMAECLPGCETLEALADDRYRAVVVVSLAGIKARFDLQVEVTERRPDGIRALTRGQEGGNASSLSASSEVRLDPASEGTQVAYTSDVSVTGRLGRFALGMMKKKAQAMGDEFAANLQRRLADAPEPVTAVANAEAVTTAQPEGPVAETPNREPQMEATGSAAIAPTTPEVEEAPRGEATPASGAAPLDPSLSTSG